MSRDFRFGALFLGAGLALSALYAAFPDGGAAQSTLYAVLGASGTLALLWGIRRHRPQKPLPWTLFALGNGLFVVGDVIWAFWPDAPTPSVIDALYLAGYPPLAAALILLMVSTAGRHRLAALADAAIVTLAFAIVQWIWVIDPAIRQTNGDALVRVVHGLYPAMGVVLLAGFAGFFTSPAWRTPAFRLLVAAVGALVLADELSVVYSSAYDAGSVIRVAWLASYVLWGAAALHPSMRDLDKPRRTPTLRVSPWRMGLLTVALLTGPAALLAQDQRRHVDVEVIVGLQALIVVLVVARLTGILRALERIRRRERAARAAAETAQRQLAEQNARLVEADRIKDEFVALISHDLRTPLTSIIGYVELALDEEVEPPLDEERRSYLAVVSRSSERLLRLVDDLLFVARLQAEQLVLDPVPLDLRAVAAQAVTEALPHAERKGVILEFVGDEPVRVEADKGRLFQLLDNLISNAIKFTPEAGRVDVRALRSPGGGVLEVRDTGIGLSADELELVFERFFRSTRAVDGQIPGTGLGLFISRAIAEAHGGSISAERRESGGTTFRIELPIPAGTTEALA